jgi:hypothetical protein
MLEDADQMVEPRTESNGDIIQRVGQTLDRPIKVRCGGVDKKEVIEPFRD